MISRPKIPSRGGSHAVKATAHSRAWEPALLQNLDPLMISRVDLHLHSTASDGQFSPPELVAMALERDLIAIAITDHDTTAGIDEALEAALCRCRSTRLIIGAPRSTSSLCALGPRCPPR